MSPDTSLTTLKPDTILGLEETLIQAAQAYLFEEHGSTLSLGEWTWKPITHGGSDRHFFRVQHSQGGSWVVMKYNQIKEENTFYVEIAHFLRGIGLHVPRVIFHDKDLCLIGLEDLGEISLHSFYQKNKNSPELSALYDAALTQAQKLHQFSTAPVPTMKGFDEKLYRWERNYFLENLVEKWGEIHLDGTESNDLQTEGERMSDQLMKCPCCLIHRDFQSQNLMIRNNVVWMIDFQGMRLGHAAYDVASLLYDPYVDLTHSQRASFLVHDAAGISNAKNWETVFYCAAVQRLMQALGAYSFLGLVKGKREFLKHIPKGLENLADALSKLKDMNQTLRLVERLQSVAAEVKG